MKPLIALLRAWNTKTVALRICGNTAFVPAWMTCVPTHDSRRCLKKSESKHEHPPNIASSPHSRSEGERESHPNYNRLAMFARRGEPPILHGIHCFLCK